MDNEEVLEWAPRVKRVARAVTMDFPDVDQDDIEQSLWEGILGMQAKGKLLDQEGENVESMCFYMARSAAWTNRKEHLTLSVQYAYRTSDVRALLETFFDKSSWYDAQAPVDAYTELGSAALEMSADLSRAYDRLPEDYKKTIVLAFGVGAKLESKKVSRAIARMADILNSPSTLTKRQPRRTVINNATAEGIIQNSYSGDDRD
jgi:DNA-directed RNA polymerase specialized sigma24 family protein